MFKNFDQIRQSSVIFNAGPGALTVLQNGSTVILAGIDTWYWNKQSSSQLIPLQARITDRRLALSMNVGGFVQPPAEGIADGLENETVLASLFPTWVTCFACDTLKKLSANDPKIPYCQTCLVSKNIKRQMVQVNFIIACENGHLDEFPWLEWVHRGATCMSGRPALKLSARGAVELRSQKVSCSACGKSRTLAGTTEFGTLEKLSGNPSESFKCIGAMPWLRKTEDGCDSSVRMVQRNANNIYFSATETSILVPETTESTALIVDHIDRSAKRQMYFGLLLSTDWDYDIAATILKTTERPYYDDFSHEEIISGLMSCEPAVEIPLNPKSSSPETIDKSVDYDRSPEWLALTSPREHKDLVVRESSNSYSKALGLSKFFAVPLLRRTVALTGFSRLTPSSISPGRGRMLLRRNPYQNGADWLPAVQHTGEGIVVTFDSGKLLSWEKRPEVMARAKLIESRLSFLAKELPHGQEVTPRFLLLHSFAHGLIQQLVMESGYTSASLAERIYPAESDAGVLIFTAASDGDGTMGGLVEMADPTRLLRAIERTLEHYQWCSNDPVCMEMGAQGQGTFGANGAACHSCSLLPETSCDYQNMGLDRALLVGDALNEGSKIGFFQS
jgi:hypothetical protein